MICRVSGLYQDFDFNRCSTTWPYFSRVISTSLVKFNQSFDYERFSSPLGTYFWSFVPNLACVQPTPTHRKKIGKVNCLLARRRFTWGRTLMCLIQDVINRKKVLKLKLNSIWNKIHNFYLQRLTWSSRSEVHLQLVCGHGSTTFSPGYQLPATCVHLAKVRLRCIRNNQNRNKLIEIRVCPFVA